MGTETHLDLNPFFFAGGPVGCLLIHGGSLAVAKTVDWNGYQVDTTQTFEICITGPSYATPNCKTITTAQVTAGEKLLWDNLIPGEYTVTETGQDEWTVVCMKDAVAQTSATTAKPRPCSPARAASIAAFRASRLV